MEKILVYGDSNVWGDNFYTKKRLSHEKQWVNILNEYYKNKKLFIQEGLPGRIAGDYEQKKIKNGKDTFLTIFKTAAPIDKIIISLGTNDLQIKYNRNIDQITKDLLWYKEVLKEIYVDEEDKQKYFNNKFPEIHFIIPINFDYKNEVKNVFNEKSEKLRLKLIEKLKEENLIILNNACLLKDGVHLNEEGHKQMVEKIKEVL